MSDHQGSELDRHSPASTTGVSAILLDIEGTTSSISFVHDVMFAYVREHLDEFLTTGKNKDECEAACDQIARDAGHNGCREAFGGDLDQPAVCERLAAHVRQLMDKDAKATGLKQLQGLIWKSAFESGQLQAHVYDDVPPALRQWTELGRSLWIYSSGSVAAQKLFFAHSTAGNLLHFFRGHWDTNIGHKRESETYARIAASLGESEQLAASQILFISDVPVELDAARTAGMQTALSVRPGNHPVDDACTHRHINSFAEI